MDTLATIRNDEFYVFTHPRMHDEVKEWFAGITAAMDKAATRTSGVATGIVDVSV